MAEDKEDLTLQDSQTERPEAETEEDEDEHVSPVTPEFVREFRGVLWDEDPAEAQALIDDLHVADQADLLELLPPDDREKLIEMLRPAMDPELFSEVSEPVRDEIIEQMAPGELADVISQMDTDDAVYVLEDLDEDEQRRVLNAIPADERAAIEESLAYPDESAGRLMQRDLIAAPMFWNVGQLIDFMRGGDELPEDFYEIFVVDPAHHPVGTVPLSRILRSPRNTPVTSIMDEEQHLIPVDMDQEQVAFMFQQYRLSSAAVVDNDERLVGVITFDDVVEVIKDEAEADILALGGVSAESDLNQPILSVTRTRFNWLVVNLATAVLASWVISMFEGSINKLVQLAVLMPIVASMGGNAGTQTLTVAVRALATRELMSSNAMRMIVKEATMAILNGAGLGLLIGLAAGYWSNDWKLGGVMASAMVINLLAAGLAGALIPLALEKAGVDPAVSSTVFVTTVTDVVGFFAFLGLATLLLL